MSLDKTNPLSLRNNLVDVVHHAILQQIESGGIKAGERLPTEEALCHHYRVSRSTVREALIRLRAAGLVISRPRAGTFVSTLAKAATLTLPSIACVQDIQRYYEFRCCLETGAAKQAALMQDSRDITSIRSAYHAVSCSSAYGDWCVDADFALHNAIAVASKKPMYVTGLIALRPHMLFTMQMSFELSAPQWTQRSFQICSEHHDIVEAIIKRDCRAASDAMQTHIKNSMRRILGDAVKV
jgi:DNA-binding FadR family transcriptional regulator